MEYTKISGRPAPLSKRGGGEPALRTDAEFTEERDTDVGTPGDGVYRPEVVLSEYRFGKGGCEPEIDSWAIPGTEAKSIRWRAPRRRLRSLHTRGRKEATFRPWYKEDMHRYP